MHIPERAGRSKGATKQVALLLALPFNSFVLEERAKAVASCVEEVNKQTGQTGKERFDAYVTSHNTVKMFGTDREMFLFDRCMTQKGHALGPTNEYRDKFD